LTNPYILKQYKHEVVSLIEGGVLSHTHSTEQTSFGHAKDVSYSHLLSSSLGISKSGLDAKLIQNSERFKTLLYLGIELNSPCYTGC